MAYAEFRFHEYHDGENLRRRFSKLRDPESTRLWIQVAAVIVTGLLALGLYLGHP